MKLCTQLNLRIKHTVITIYNNYKMLKYEFLSHYDQSLVLYEMEC